MNFSVQACHRYASGAVCLQTEARPGFCFESYPHGQAQTGWETRIVLALGQVSGLKIRFNQLLEEFVHGAEEEV